MVTSRSGTLLIFLRRDLCGSAFIKAWFCEMLFKYISSATRSVPHLYATTYAASPARYVSAASSSMLLVYHKPQDTFSLQSLHSVYLPATSAYGSQHSAPFLAIFSLWFPASRGGISTPSLLPDNTLY